MSRWTPTGEAEIIFVGDENEPEAVQSAFEGYVQNRLDAGWKAVVQKETYAILNDGEGTDWMIDTGLCHDRVVARPGRFT